MHALKYLQKKKMLVLGNCVTTKHIQEIAPFSILEQYVVMHDFSVDWKSEFRVCKIHFSYYKIIEVNYPNIWPLFQSCFPSIFWNGFQLTELMLSFEQFWDIGRPTAEGFCFYILSILHKVFTICGVFLILFFRGIFGYKM